MTSDRYTKIVPTVIAVSLARKIERVPQVVLDDALGRLSALLGL